MTTNINNRVPSTPLHTTAASAPSAGVAPPPQETAGQVDQFAANHSSEAAQASPLSAARALFSSGAPAPAAPTSPYPKAIYIIRHGEKPDPSTGDTGLDPQGEARAQALVTALPRDGIHPDAILATQPTSGSDRPLDTVKPEAQSLGLTIDDSFQRKQTSQAASALTSGKYADQEVLVSWDHGHIPGLATALGVSEQQLESSGIVGSNGKWPGAVFDRILKVTYGTDGKPTVQNLPENALPGDSTYTSPPVAP